MTKNLENAILTFNNERSRDKIEGVIAAFIQSLVEKDKVIVPVDIDEQTKDSENVTASIKRITLDNGEPSLVCFTSEEMLNKGQKTESDEIILLNYVKMVMEHQMNLVINPWYKPFIFKADTLTSLIQYLEQLDEED